MISCRVIVCIVHLVIVHFMASLWIHIYNAMLTYSQSMKPHFVSFSAKWSPSTLDQTTMVPDSSSIHTKWLRVSSSWANSISLHEKRSHTSSRPHPYHSQPLSTLTSSTPTRLTWNNATVWDISSPTEVWKFTLRYLTYHKYICRMWAFTLLWVHVSLTRTRTLIFLTWWMW